MTVKIKIYSDYVCPFCLLAKKPLEEAIEGKTWKWNGCRLSCVRIQMKL